MRITHVVGTAEFAGLERYAVDVSVEQAARGHDVVVLGGAPAMMGQLLEGRGVQWRADAPAPSLVRALVGGGRRDVLHSHITRADFCAAVARPLVRAAHLSTRHITAARGYGWVARRAAPALRASLSVEVAVSAWTSAQLERPSDAVLLNGVPTQDGSAEPRQRTVVMAHRLAPEKDTSTGLRAWAASGLAHCGWRLEVAGRGPDREALEREAADLGVGDSTDFLGWVSDSAALFRSAGLFLAPAPTEPCGLSILEAMSWGTPVVAAASGGNTETVGSVAGAVTFAAGDAACAGEQLRLLAADDDRRAAYGALLRQEQRRRFSTEVHVDGLMALYERASAG